MLRGISVLRMLPLSYCRFFSHFKPIIGGRMTALTPVKSPVSPAVDDDFGDVVQQTAGQRPNYHVEDPMAPISGFTNYSTEEMAAFSEWQERMVEVYLRNGYTGLVPRPVEYAALLQKKGGIDKQMYGVSRMQDGTLTKLGLPFDRTVPLAIFVAQNVNNLKFPFWRYDTGWVFRGEHASKGRYRGFVQSDTDIISRNPSIKEDAQAGVIVLQALQAIGVPKCKMVVNHIAIAKGFMASAGIPDASFPAALRAIDKLKPDNYKDVLAELVANIPELTTEKADALLKSMAYDGPLSKFEPPKNFPQTALDGLESLRKTEKMIEAMGIEPGVIQFRPFLTRGLDYYTGIVYETFIPGQERFGSIASGGRYDNLIDDLSGKKTGLGGVGISIGVTRLFDVMKELKLVNLKRQTRAEIFVGYRTEDQYFKALELAKALRERGIKTEIHLSDKKVAIKNQVGLCDEKGIPFAALVMNDDEIILKDMTKSAKDTVNQVTFSKVNDFVQAAFKAIHPPKDVTESKTP